MSKRIVVISASPRKGGNTDLLCDEFVRGAVESGNDVEKINLRGKRIGFCTACYHCKDGRGECCIKDDVPEIISKMEAADIIVLASPVYFYSVDAQLKALIDRFNARWKAISGKTFYYIAAGAETHDHVTSCTIDCMRGLAECLEGSVEGGTVEATGVFEKGTIVDTPFMRQAYEMGKGCHRCDSMKVMAVNGSPRKGWNTDMLLEKGLEGAASVGAETEMVHLADLDFSGCVSCFACRRKNADYCRCYHRDGLTPVLERALDADVLLLGSPIYFGDVTGMMRNFLERLGFVTMTYDDMTRVIHPKRTDAAFFFTMNLPSDYRGYDELYERTMFPLMKLGGTVEHHQSCDTLQFDDYSKYRAAGFDAEHKAEVRRTQFPKDLENAYSVGRRLASRDRRLSVAPDVNGPSQSRSGGIRL